MIKVPPIGCLIPGIDIINTRIPKIKIKPGSKLGGRKVLTEEEWEERREKILKELDELEIL